MIATAEVLNGPTHTTEPRFDFLADLLLSDLHAENILRIFKTRLGGSPKISEFFSGTYTMPLPPLAAISQEVADVSPLEIATGGIVFTHGPGIDEPLILHTQDANTGEIKSDYYLSDVLGSITELAGKDGTITGEIAHSSFGKIVHSSGNALDQCYSYTGREFDRESGLMYYRARYYDPQLGGFLQSDIEKIVQPHNFSKTNFSLFDFYLEGLGRISIDASERALRPSLATPKYNLEYAYAANAPTNWTDPKGEFFGSLTLIGIMISGVIQSKLRVKDAVTAANVRRTVLTIFAALDTAATLWALTLFVSKGGTPEDRERIKEKIKNQAKLLGGTPKDVQESGNLPSNDDLQKAPYHLTPSDLADLGL